MGGTPNLPPVAQNRAERTNDSTDAFLRELSRRATEKKLRQTEGRRASFLSQSFSETRSASQRLANPPGRSVTGVL
jgi:hypothetical protein